MSTRIIVKVVPGSGRSGAALDKNGTLKIYLKNQAEQGKANAELIKKIAKALRVPQDDVQIVAGATSRNKTIEIANDIVYEDLLKALGIETQMGLF